MAFVLTAWLHAKAVAAARGTCGCARLAQLQAAPPVAPQGAEAQAHAAELHAAANLQRVWDCPAAGGRGVPGPDAAVLGVDVLARHACTTMGVPATGTCPWAALHAPLPHVHEIFDAMTAAGEGALVPLEISLGRDVTVRDLTAITTYKRAVAAAHASDARLRELAREAPTPDAAGAPAAFRKFPRAARGRGAHG